MACILWSSAASVHDSQAHRKMDVTRERINRIFELREMLLSFQTSCNLFQCCYLLCYPGKYLQYKYSEGWVQYKMISKRSGKSLYAPPRLSYVSLVTLWSSSFFCVVIFDSPFQFSSRHGRLPTFANCSKPFSSMRSVEQYLKTILLSQTPRAVTGHRLLNR